MSNDIDYAAVLMDLKAKRSALDSAITGLEQWLSLKTGQIPEVNQTLARVDRTGQPGEIQSDTFFGTSIPDAIRKCLRIMKRPMALTEITKALQDGGLLTTAKDLASTISATLTRIKRTDGDVLQVQGKWGLAEWYPGMRKEKLEVNVKGKKGRKRGRTKGLKMSALKADAQSSNDKAEQKASAAKPTTEQIEQMKTLHASGKHFGEIAKILGLQTLTVWRALKAVRVAKPSLEGGSHATSGN